MIVVFVGFLRQLKLGLGFYLYESLSYILNTKLNTKPKKITIPTL